MEILASGQLLFSALVLGATYALIALGLNLVYGTMRLLNVAHGDLVMLGAYVAYWLFTFMTVSPLLSMFLAMVIAAGLGALAYVGIFRRQLAERATAGRLEANSLLLFFGLSVIMQNVASLVFTGSLRAYQYLDEVYIIGGVAMTGNRLVMLLLTISVCVALTLFLRLMRLKSWQINWLAKSLFALIRRQPA